MRSAARHRGIVRAALGFALISFGTTAHAQSTDTADTGQRVTWNDAREPGRAAGERQLIELHLALRRVLSRRAQLDSVGRALSSDTQLRELGDQLEALTRRAPALVTAWLDLADIDFELRDGTAMLRHLDEASARAGEGPMRVSVLSQLAIAYTLLDRFTDARDAYRSALELPMSNAARGISLCNLGEIETYLHEPEASISHYEQCVSLLPAYDGGFWGLASAYDREGREFEAREAAERALSIDPAAASLTSHTVFYTPAYEVHYYLGLAREAQGRRAEALLEWQRYLDAGGANDAWATRARAHVRALTQAANRTPHRR
jgi:tetratricopeptide (TPR) repeat protein